MTTLTRASASTLPVLEPGDHLSLEEFERLYAQRPDIYKAELIDGVVYMPSPVRIPEHGDPASLMAGWAANYRVLHSGVGSSTDGSTGVTPDDKVQPDVMLWYESGPAYIDAETHHLVGPPQLVVEVATSSASYDLHEKKRLYERAGVQEYVVWRTLDKAIDWFELEDGEYVPLEPDASGITHSRVFPGLKLDIPRLLRGDGTAILPS